MGGGLTRERIRRARAPAVLCPGSEACTRAARQSQLISSRLLVSNQHSQCSGCAFADARDDLELAAHLLSAFAHARKTVAASCRRNHRRAVTKYHPRIESIAVVADF